MKKLILIISLFTCIKAFGQTTPPPVSPTSVPTMSWYYEPSTHKMFAYRGAVLGWVQMTDSLQVVRMIQNAGSSFALTNGNGTTANGTAVDLGGVITNGKTQIVLNGNIVQFVAGGNGVSIGENQLFVQYNNNDLSKIGLLSISQDGANIGYQNIDNNIKKVDVNSSDILVTDQINNKGLTYASHYNFAQSPQQIPDRQYVDSVASASGSGSLKLGGANQNVTQTPTFSNGFTASGGTISNINPQFVISTTVNGSNQTLTQAGQTFTNNSGTTTYGLNTAGSTNLVTGNPIYYQSILRSYYPPTGNPYDVLNKRSADSLYATIPALATKLNSSDTTNKKLLTTTNANGIYGVDTRNFTSIQTAINYAATNGITNVIIPAGTYTIASQITIPTSAHINLIGNGSGNTILDGSAGTYANFTNKAIVYATGSESTLGTLNQAGAIGDTYIRVSSTSGLVRGSLIHLQDTTGASFSGYRAAYRQGEFLTVIRTNGDSVFVDKPLQGKYAIIASAFVYSVAPTQFSMKGIQVKSFNTNDMCGVIVNDGLLCRFEDVTIYGAARSNFEFDESKDILVDGCSSKKYDIDQNIAGNTAYPMTSYGISINGVQGFTCRNSDLYGDRHAIATVGSTSPAVVVNRQGVIYGNTMNSNNNYSYDLHGNSENYEIYDNPLIANGANLSGRNIKFHNNYVNNKPNDLAIQISEMKDMSLDIYDNDIVSNRRIIAGDAGIKILAWNSDFGNFVDTAGTFRFRDNRVFFASTSTTTLIPFIVQRTATGAFNGEVEITNNTFKCISGGRVVMTVAGFASGSNMKSFISSSNTYKGIKLSVSDFSNGISQGDRAGDVYWSSIGFNRVANVRIINPTFFNFDIAPSGTTTEAAPFSIQSATNAWVDGVVAYSTNNATLRYYYNIITNLYEGSYSVPSLATGTRTSITNSLPLDYKGGTAGQLPYTNSNGTLSYVALTGLIKGNGTSAPTAAIAGTDYAPAILATLTGVNAKTTGTTALYTVPTGKTLMVTGVYIKCTAATAITASASADVGVAAGSVYTNTSNGLTLATQAYQYPVGGIQINPTTGQVVNFNINTAATGTSQTYSVTLIGYLF